MSELVPGRYIKFRTEVSPDVDMLDRLERACELASQD